MAEVINPNDVTVQGLMASIAAANERLNAARRSLAAQQVRLGEWQAKVARSRHGASDEDRTAIADASRWIQTHTQEVESITREIGELNDQLTRAKEAQAKFNEGLATAAGEGLTGEAAVARAQSLVESQKGKTFLLVAVGIALLLLLALFIYRKWVAK